MPNSPLSSQAQEPGGQFLIGEDAIARLGPSPAGGCRSPGNTSLDAALFDAPAKERRDPTGERPLRSARYALATVVRQAATSAWVMSAIPRACSGRK